MKLAHLIVIWPRNIHTLSLMVVVLMVGILFKRTLISDKRLITLLKKGKNNVKFIVNHYKIKQCLNKF